MRRCFNRIRGRPREISSQGLRLDPVALFVFLPAAAWAGIVAPYLLAGPALRGLAGFAAAGAAGRLQFPLLLALELLLESIDRGRRLPRGNRNLPRRCLQHLRPGCAGHRWRRRNRPPRLSTQHPPSAPTAPNPESG